MLFSAFYCHGFLRGDQKVKGCPESLAHSHKPGSLEAGTVGVKDSGTITYYNRLDKTQPLST